MLFSYNRVRMNSSDIIYTIVILIMFSIIYSNIAVSNAIVNINKDWHKYRCNPVFMPFAAVFGHDTIKNFNYCIASKTNTDTPMLMESTNNDVSLLGRMGDDMNSDIVTEKKNTDVFKFNVVSSFGSVYDIMMNVVLEFYKISLSIKDMLGKTVGVAGTLVYTLEGSILTMKSANNTVFMKALQKISKMKVGKKGCFSGDTMIQLENGDYKRIDTIEINDVLKYETRVLATMKITNVNPANGNMISSVYMIPRGDKEDDILVTGSHLIYDKSLKRFVYVRDYSKSIKTKRRLEVVYCLITDNHTIPISDYIFHDWEDTPNKSKDILCI